MKSLPCSISLAGFLVETGDGREQEPANLTVTLSRVIGDTHDPRDNPQHASLGPVHAAQVDILWQLGACPVARMAALADLGRDRSSRGCFGLCLVPVRLPRTKPYETKPASTKSSRPAHMSACSCLAPCASCPAPHTQQEPHTLSHIVEIKTEVRDEQAVKAACARLNLAPPVNKSARLFNETV